MTEKLKQTEPTITHSKRLQQTMAQKAGLQQSLSFSSKQPLLLRRLLALSLQIDTATLQGFHLLVEQSLTSERAVGSETRRRLQVKTSQNHEATFGIGNTFLFWTPQAGPLQLHFLSVNGERLLKSTDEGAWQRPPLSWN